MSNDPGTISHEAGTISHEERRAAVERLATAIRALADAAVETAIAPRRIDEIAATLRTLTDQLGEETDNTPYSGLVRPPVDYTIPEAPMPLNPIIGACSPTRPDVRLWFADGEVHGTARLSKRFVGPPGVAHGGIGAMLADQIVAVAPSAVGLRCVTKQLHVWFRRPLPLDEEIGLWGACQVDGDAITARYTISAQGEVAVEGTAELVRYDRLAGRDPQRRRNRHEDDARG
jgi:acyl-coenzyme A thioesterase PaaI-like protein